VPVKPYRAFPPTLAPKAFVRLVTGIFAPIGIFRAIVIILAVGIGIRDGRAVTH
jgi:hypothetical protein